MAEERPYALEDSVGHSSSEKANQLLTRLLVARQAVLTEVAMLLQRFDVELTEPGSFPRFDEAKPVLGIVSLKKGDDPLVRLRKRNTRF